MCARAPERESVRIYHILEELVDVLALVRLPLAVELGEVRRGGRVLGLSHLRGRYMYVHEERGERGKKKNGPPKKANGGIARSKEEGEIGGGITKRSSSRTRSCRRKMASSKEPKQHNAINGKTYSPSALRAAWSQVRCQLRLPGLAGLMFSFADFAQLAPTASLLFHFSLNRVFAHFATSSFSSHFNSSRT